MEQLTEEKHEAVFQKADEWVDLFARVLRGTLPLVEAEMRPQPMHEPSVPRTVEAIRLQIRRTLMGNGTLRDELDKVEAEQVLLEATCLRGLATILETDHRHSFGDASYSTSFVLPDFLTCVSDKLDVLGKL